MKISEALNLVIPCYDDEDNVYAYVHSTPISRETYAANYRLMAKTFTLLFKEGMGDLTGPRVAQYALREVAETMSNEPDELIAPLMNEIRRLTHVIVATPNGWDSMLLHDAINRKALTEEDVATVFNAVTFFILASAILLRRQLKETLPGLASLWQGLITSSTSSQYHSSLPILSGIDSSGRTASQVAHRESISSLPS